ncbi:hypothetical protein V6Z11_A11G075000 [Gossypium hirsutum]
MQVSSVFERNPSVHHHSNPHVIPKAPSNGVCIIIDKQANKITELLGHCFQEQTMQQIMHHTQKSQKNKVTNIRSSPSTNL